MISEALTGLAPTNYGYDVRGRLVSLVQGAERPYSFSYDANGYLAGITDPLARTVGFEYDAAGRVLRQTLPDRRAIRYTYDANGNLTSVQPPGRTAHVFDYTPVNLEEQYTPPALDGVDTVTHYTYNRDKQLTQIQRPDGTTVGFGYDTGGRLSTLTTPRGSVGYGYHPATGQLVTITAPDGGTLSYAWDGFLPLSEVWSGPISGTVSRAYDANFWVKSLAVNGQAVSYGYAADGLLTSAGALTLARDAQTGLLTGTALGGVTTSAGYNGFGNSPPKPPSSAARRRSPAATPAMPPGASPPRSRRWTG